MDRFSGDPKLILTVDGADMVIKGGQPVMDQGLENAALISLFTKPDWPGNFLIEDEEQQPGSDFEEISKGIINLDYLNNVRQSAEKALTNGAFGKKTIDVFNPTSKNVRINIIIDPPGVDIEELILTKNGPNWISQKNNPAHKRI